MTNVYNKNIVLHVVFEIFEDCVCNKQAVLYII